MQAQQIVEVACRNDMVCQEARPPGSHLRKTIDAMQEVASRLPSLETVVMSGIPQEQSPVGCHREPRATYTAVMTYLLLAAGMCIATLQAPTIARFRLSWADS